MCVPRGTGALILGLLLAGCKTYEPEPLNPNVELRRLQDFDLGKVRVRRIRPGEKKPSKAPIPFDPKDGLSEAEAVGLALTINPRLRVRRHGKGAADARLITAGLWPNPRIGVSWLPGVDGAPGVSMDGQWLTEVVRLWERFARVDAAREGTREAEAAIVAAEWQLVADVRVAYWQVQLMTQVESLLKEQVKQQERAVNLVRRREKLGEGTKLETTLAELGLLELRRDLLRAGSATMAARAGLNRLLGVSPHEKVALSDAPITITLLERLTPKEVDRRLLAGRFELRALEHAYKRSEHELRLAIYRQYPRLSLGVAFDREAGGDYYVGPGFMVELPIFSRNQGAIAGKETQRDRLRDEYRALLYAIRSEAHAAFTALKRARLEFDLQTKKLLPLLKRLQALLAEGLRRKELNTLDWLTAQRRAFQIRRTYLMTLFSYQKAVIRLEAATGTLFTDRSSR